MKPNDAQNLWVLSRDESRAVDEVWSRRWGLPTIILMENAGVQTGVVAEQMLRASRLGCIVAVCGGGSNGGDGLSAARHLINADVDVRIVLGQDPSTLTGDTAVMWRAAAAAGVPWSLWDGRTGLLTPRERRAGALIVDAVLGTGPSGPLREHSTPVALIRAINAARRTGTRRGRAASRRLATTGRVRVLAVDVPSGMDAQTGEGLGVECVRADTTVTFVGVKRGMLTPSGMKACGGVVVADIGIPDTCVGLARSGRRGAGGRVREAQGKAGKLTGGFRRRD
jgi:NAD(P)H-hydrate epimerase